MYLHINLRCFTDCHSSSQLLDGSRSLRSSRPWFIHTYHRTRDTTYSYNRQEDAKGKYQSDGPKTRYQRVLRRARRSISAANCLVGNLQKLVQTRATGW